MFNEKFWLAIAFTTFALAIIKYVWPTIAKALDSKSKEIAEELLAAKDLKEKASALLLKAEKAYKDSLSFSEKLLKDTAEESEKISEDSKKLLESEIAKKTAAALDRIKLEQEIAIREMKEKIVTDAIKNLTENLKKDMDKSSQDQLLLKATKDLEALN